MKVIRRNAAAACDLFSRMNRPAPLVESSPLPTQDGPQNRTLDLDDFMGLCANLHDRRGIQMAARMVDKFVDVRSFDGRDFRTDDFKALYEHLFPNRDEAEPFGDIVRRLDSMRKLDEGDAGMASRFGRTRYHVIAALNKGRVVGFTLFSTIALDEGKMLVYSQYAGLADRDFMRRQYRSDENFRSKGLLYLAYPFMQGIALEDGRKFGAQEVVGVVNESEMIGQGKGFEDIVFSKLRLEIFNRNGVKVMMASMPDGRLLTPHVQPNLVEGTNPIYLHLAFRPLTFDLRRRGEADVIGKEDAMRIITAVMDVFEAEDFAPDALKAARREAMERIAAAEKMLLLPPSQLPDMVSLARQDPLLAEQVVRDYGSLYLHELKIKASLGISKALERSLGE